MPFLKLKFPEEHIYNFYYRYAQEGGIVWNDTLRPFRVTTEYFLSRPCTETFYIELPTGKYKVYVIEGKVFIPGDLVRKLEIVYLGDYINFRRQFRPVTDYHIVPINKIDNKYWIVLSSNNSDVVNIPIKIYPM